MRRKIEIAVVVALVLAISSMAVMSRMYFKERSNRTRIENNQTVLLSDVEYYKTADSLSAVKVQSLELTRRELKRSNVEYEETIKQLDIERKRLISLTQIKTETKVELKTVVKDSLVYVNDTTVKEMRCIDYADPFVSISGCMDDVDFIGEIKIPIKIDIVGDYTPKKFLGLIPYGFDYASLNVLADNKYTDITYVQDIKLQKKKRRKKRK